MGNTFSAFRHPRKQTSLTFDQDHCRRVSDLVSNYIDFTDQDDFLSIP